MLCLCLELLGVFAALFLARLEEILATLELQVDLAGLLWWRERRIDLLLRGFLGLLGLDARFLELRQKTIPRLIGKLWILSKLSLNHQLLDMVNRVNVLHTVKYYPAHFFETLVRTHSAHCIALYKDVTTGKELDGLKRAAIRTDYTLAPLNKALFVAHNVSNLDNIAGHIILKDFDSLREWNTAAQQLDQIACAQDNVRVKGFTGRAYGH